MMRIEIYGNVNIDSPFFTDQTWSIELTESIMSCVSPSLHGKRKVLGESKANRKIPLKNIFFPQTSRSNFPGAGNAKNWKVNAEICNTYFMFRTALGNRTRDRKN